MIVCKPAKIVSILRKVAARPRPAAPVAVASAVRRAPRVAKYCRDLGALALAGPASSIGKSPGDVTPAAAANNGGGPVGAGALPLGELTEFSIASGAAGWGGVFATGASDAGMTGSILPVGSLLPEGSGFTPLANLPGWPGTGIPEPRLLGPGGTEPGIGAPFPGGPSSPTPVPEPAALALFLFAATALLLLRRMRPAR